MEKEKQKERKAWQKQELLSEEKRRQYQKNIQRKKLIKAAAEVSGRKVSTQIEGGEEAYTAAGITIGVGRLAARVGRTGFYLLGSLGGVLGILLLFSLPVLLVVLILYHSPFALFMPQLEEGETIQSITNAYVSEFFHEVEQLAEEHSGHDAGEVRYQDLEGNHLLKPDPQYDILCVYMIRYGIGDTATIMDDRGKRRLKSVVEDMCQYEVDHRTELWEVEEQEKPFYEARIMEVTVTIKYYQDMILEYDFSTEQVEMLEQMRDGIY